MTDDVFALQPHLERLYAGGRRSGWDATSASDYAAWRAGAVTTLRRALRLEVHRLTPGTAVMLGEEPREGYRQQRWQLPIDEGVSVNCYLLLPEGPGPFVPVLVLHGHNPNVQAVLGNGDDPALKARRIARHGNYAQALAQAGHLVCAIEQRGFGARTSAGHGQDHANPWTDRHLFLHYLLQDRCLQGERVWDAMCVLDWFLGCDNLRPEQLICTGNSGGGTTTLYLAALDERVRIAIPGCAFSSFRASILSESFSHCLCNYVPGLAAELESGDVAAMIAPRPLCLINGEQDPIFPIAAAREQFAIVQRAYRAAGRPEACRLAVHPDDHRYDLPLCREWIAQWT